MTVCECYRGKMRASSGRWAAWLALAGVLACVHTSFAVLLQGGVKDTTFAYLGKFCYQDVAGVNYTAGTLNVTIETPQVDVLVLVYSADDWDDVAYKSCAEKVSADKTLAVLDVTHGKFETQLEIRPPSKPRFVYVAAATRACAYNLDVDQFRLLFLNPLGEQLSYDELGLNSMYILFACMYLVGLSVMVYGHSRRHFWYPLPVRVFAFVLGSVTFSELCLAVHFGQLASNGVGAPFVESLGRLFGVLSRVVLMMLLAMLAAGAGYAQRGFSPRTHWPAMLLIACNVGGYFAILVWYEVVRKPWSTKYIYVNGFGGFLVLVNVLFAMWFVRALRQQYSASQDAHARTFIKRVGAVGVLALSMLPLCVIVGALVTAYARKRAVFALQEALELLVCAFTAFLLFPTSSQSFFLPPKPASQGHDDRAGDSVALLAPADSAGAPLTTGFVSLDPTNAADDEEDDML